MEALSLSFKVHYMYYRAYIFFFTRVYCIYFKYTVIEGKLEDFHLWIVSQIATMAGAGIGV